MFLGIEWFKKQIGKLVCYGYTFNVMYFKNPNCHMIGLPWDVDKAHNNSKGIKTHTRHPKVKWTRTSNARVGMMHFSLVFSTIFGSTLGTIWWQDGNYKHPHCHKNKHCNQKFKTQDKG
jgi:hypothetical protein